jgi:cytochrome c553
MRGLSASRPTRAPRLFTMTTSKISLALLLVALPVLSLAQGAPAAPAPQAAAPSAPAPTGDSASGARKTQMCAGCHGIDGWRTAFPEVYHVPKIGGQHPAYIVKALQEYKSGERSHPSMRAIAASLSDQDMADLAAYYGGTPPKTASK